MSASNLRPIVLSAASIALGAALGYLFASASPQAVQATGPLPVLADGTPTATDGRPFTAAPGQAATPSLAPAGGPSSPTAADAEEAVERSDAAAADLEALDIVAGSALAELQSYLRTGSVERRFAESEDGAAQFLIAQYLADSNPGAALARLRQGPSLNAETWGQVAHALNGSGDTALALEAFEAAIRHDDSAAEWNWSVNNWLEQIGSEDPGLALGLLNERTQGMETVPPNLTLQSARLLAKQGRIEEARSELIGLLEREEEIYSTLSQLAEVDPELAEQELRARHDLQNGTDLEGQLFSLLRKQGREDEAIELLDARLALGHNSAEMIQEALSNMPSELIEPHLAGWLESAENSSQLQINVGSHYLAQGDTGRAIEHFGSGWESSFENGEGWLPVIPQGMMDADPTGVLGLLRDAENRAGTNDEVWGDVADHYWRLGNREEAIAAWRRAAEIDPDDSEWSRKVSSYESGADPLPSGNSGPMIQTLSGLGYSSFGSIGVQHEIMELGY